MTPLRQARHSLIRAWVAEVRSAKLHVERSYEWSPNPGLSHDRRVAAWYEMSRAADLAEQARAVGEAMRVLQTLVDNPVRLEPCLPPQCVWCERQQPRYNGAHTPDCALARLVSPG